MNISFDYSYLNTNQMKLIGSGYGEIEVYSLHFDRYVSEEQRAENLRFFESMTDEQRREYYNSEEFENVQRKYAEALNRVREWFNSKYDIHQGTPGKSTMEHYRSDWDLFLWSDEGWNDKDYITTFSLTVNENRSKEQNEAMMNEIILAISAMENDSVCCRVQYYTIIDREAVAKAANEAFDSIKDEFVALNGCIGKVKIVSRYYDCRQYGFFKKGARSKYREISNEDLLLMTI